MDGADSSGSYIKLRRVSGDVVDPNQLIVTSDGSLVYKRKTTQSANNDGTRTPSGYEVVDNVKKSTNIHGGNTASTRNVSLGTDTQGESEAARMDVHTDGISIPVDGKGVRNDSKRSRNDDTDPYDILHDSTKTDNDGYERPGGGRKQGSGFRGPADRYGERPSAGYNHGDRYYRTVLDAAAITPPPYTGRKALSPRPETVEKEPKDGEKRKPRTRQIAIIAAIVFVLLAGAAIAVYLLIIKPEREERVDDIVLPEVPQMFSVHMTALGLPEVEGVVDTESEMFRNLSDSICTEVSLRIRDDNLLREVYEGCAIETLIGRGNNVSVKLSIFVTKHDRISTEEDDIQSVILGPPVSGDEAAFGSLRILRSSVDVTYVPLIQDNRIRYIPYAGYCSAGRGDICVAPPSECINDVCTCSNKAFYDVDTKLCVGPSLTFTKTSDASAIGQRLIIECSLTMKDWMRLSIVKDSASSSTCVDGDIIVDVVKTGSGFRNSTKDGYSVKSRGLSSTGAILEIVFDVLGCLDSGEYTCLATDSDFCTSKLSANDSVLVTSSPTAPVLTAPSLVFPSNVYTVTCGGYVGLETDGGAAGDLTLQIRQMDGNVTTVREAESVYVADQCQHQQTLTYIFTATLALDKAQLTCVTDVVSGDDKTSDTKTLTVVTSQGVNFSKSIYIGIMGNPLTLTCAVDNVENLTQIQITRGVINREIAVLTLTSSSPSIEGVVIVTSNTWIQPYAGRLSVLIEETKCGDDDVYSCKAGGFVANTTVSLTRLADVPILTLSYQIIETKSTWQDRMFRCSGQLGSSGRSLDVETNINGQFSSLFAGSSPLGYVFGRTESSMDCGYFVNKTFDFHRINMTLHGVLVRCVVRPASGETQTVVSESQMIEVLPLDLCQGFSFTDILHPYSCTSYVYCRDNGNIGEVKLCADGLCFSPDQQKCILCSEVDCSRNAEVIS